MQSEFHSFNHHKTHKHAIFHKKVSFSFFKGHIHVHTNWPNPLRSNASVTNCNYWTSRSSSKCQSQFPNVQKYDKPWSFTVHRFCNHFCTTRLSIAAFLTYIFGLDSKNAPLWLGFLMNCGTVRIRPAMCHISGFIHITPGRQFKLHIVRHILFSEISRNLLSAPLSRIQCSQWRDQ